MAIRFIDKTRRVLAEVITHGNTVRVRPTVTKERGCTEDAYY